MALVPITPVLGINTGFAVNRFAEPEAWGAIVGRLGLRRVQLTADLLNPDLPGALRAAAVRRIDRCAEVHGFSVSSLFTGAFTRVNHFAHPEAGVRHHWAQWFRRLVDQAVDLGATWIGSHFGILTRADWEDPTLREQRTAVAVAHWQELAAYAGERGLSCVAWETMSIGREFGATLRSARELQDRVNRGCPVPIRLVLDVDHGDHSSPDPRDTDPSAWLATFGADAVAVHLKQSSLDRQSHGPFTAARNTTGRVDPQRVLDALHGSVSGEIELLLELGFREREPQDSHVVADLEESVRYWRPFVSR